MGDPGGRSVLIVAGSDDDAVRSWQGTLASDRVIVAPAGTSPDEIGALLRRSPALDLAIVVRPEHELAPYTHGDLAGAVIPAIRRGGEYLLDRSVASDDVAPLDAWAKTRVARVRRTPPKSGRIGHAIGEIRADPTKVQITVKRTHLAMPRHSEVVDVLPSREDGATVDVLAHRPAETVRPSALVHTHTFGGGSFPAVLDTPAMDVREYTAPDGVALHGRGLATVGETVLPDSFRWHLAEKLYTPRTAPGPSAEWRRIPPRYRPTTHRGGRVYFLDSAYPYHFGHITTEIVSRLWGWDDAKRRDPDLEVVLFHRQGPRRVPGLLTRFLTAYGIHPDDITWLDEPVSIDALVSAAPLWHQAEPYYVHPHLDEIWERLAYGLTDGSPEPATDAPERLFVSRGHGAVNRACRNQADVEAYFATRGFTVVYPEELSLADQVRTFRRARVVAGFGGSALFNTIYARSLERLIVLNHESYTARNEHLISAVRGGVEQHYFWSTPDQAHPESGFSLDAFAGGWAFDFDRNQSELDAVVREA